MKLRHTIGFTALVSLMLVSCYPVKEKPNVSRDPKNDKTAPVLTPEEQKAKEAEELKKKEEALKKEEELKKERETITEQPPEPGTSNTTGKKEETKKTADYPISSKIPGKEGFVLSPYNNKMVDVRGFPSGQLVQDPTYPASEKKYFRVP